MKKFANIKMTDGEEIMTDRTEGLKYWLNVVRSIKPLTDDEEVELGFKIQNSPKDAEGKHTDRKSINRLVEGNLRFVVSVAKRFAYAGSTTISIDDLINEGNIGLVDAAETYDPTTGFKFISYAVNHICMRINNALTYKSRLVRDYHQGVSNRHTSLDAPMTDDTDTTIGDVLCTSTDVEACIEESLRDDLMRVLNAILKPEEIAIICESFGIGRTKLKRWEIGEKRGKTVERVRQIEQLSLYKLRNNPQGLSLLSKYLS
jgi:RNA polymerase primary sigma factor